VLAVEVNYEKRLATIGTRPGQAVPRDEMIKSLKSIGYGGQFVD
jgi:hypothetical protein